MEKDPVPAKGTCTWKMTLNVAKDPVVGKGPCTWKKTLYLE